MPRSAVDIFVDACACGEENDIDTVSRMIEGGVDINGRKSRGRCCIQAPPSKKESDNSINIESVTLTGMRRHTKLKHKLRMARGVALSSSP